MIIAGQNLYRVVYKMGIEKIKDMDFQRLVLAFSEKEALSYFKEDLVVKISLVENDVSMLVPSQYLEH